MALKKIWLIVSQVEEDKDSNCSAEELDEDQEEQLKSHVLDLLLALLDYKLKDNEYKSTLVSATAVCLQKQSAVLLDSSSSNSLCSAIAFLLSLAWLLTLVYYSRDGYEKEKKETGEKGCSDSFTTCRQEGDDGSSYHPRVPHRAYQTGGLLESACLFLSTCFTLTMCV
jgi:hypothetical protein